MKNNKNKTISAEIITDSLNSCGNRLTTFIVTFPRIVLAELNAHRAFSRNSASSRAIPFEKMLNMVKEDPFIPIGFQKDHKGMQGVEYFEGEEHLQCVQDWLNARDSAIESATSFTHPVTKQLKNRLLEPFMWHTAIVTATEFENFFRLRAHPDAEIHIGELASKMLEAYNNSKPDQLKEGEWHIPFRNNINLKTLSDVAIKLGYSEIEVGDDYKFMEIIAPDLIRKISIARCARISYVNYEGKDDYEADIKLCDRLFGSVPRHLSPTEHVAMAIDTEVLYGNFKGFVQYRKMFDDENLSDERVKQYA